MPEHRLFLFLRLMKPQLDVVIISFNTRELTLRCINSIKETCGLSYAITVVDNSSTDGTAAAIRSSFAEVNLIELAANYGYAAAVNRGMASTTADICLITNADVRYFPKAIDELFYFIISRPDAGSVGLQQLYPDGSWQRSYGWRPGIKSGLYDLFGVNKLVNYLNAKAFRANFRQNRAKRTEYLDGAIFMTRRAAFDSVGGFDEDFFFYSEETDYCFRLQQKKWNNIFCPWIRSEHIRGSSSTSLPRMESIQLLVDGKIIFLKKNSNVFSLYIFAFLEALYFYLACVVAKIASAIIKQNAYWHRKHELYSIFLSAWKKTIARERRSRNV